MDRKKIHKTSINSTVNSNHKTRSYFSFFTSEFILLLVLVACICFIYKNSIKGPFIFDDVSNIQDNPYIRLTKLTLDGIISAGFESLASNRPVANISFALNYYFNGYNVVDYHLVNIFMHILTGIILFYFIKVTLELLNPQNLKLPFEKNAPPEKRSLLIHNSINSSISTPQRSLSPTSTEILFIAFFTTFIWLVHPLQTQTVSYIVQRMNCMAAMFYILSLLLYAKARLAITKRKKQALFLGCILSGILSLGSKEIAATLPFFIFLYEWYFFQDVSLKWLKRNSIYFLCILLFIILLAFFLLGSNPIKIILSNYDTRDFTLWQRVLTEYRVVIYYISLLIFPHPMRLNLLHDFSISHSFIDPMTTLLSFITILGLMVMAIRLAKRERLLSFCILWFLGNLAIESSVIGLEIIYEHRTYLPSMFICLLVVVLGYRSIKIKWFGVVLVCIVVTVFSFWTYQRNRVWSDSITFWRDCVRKSPQKVRPHNNLGEVLADQGHITEAAKHYLEALRINPYHTEAHNNLGVVLKTQGKISEAIGHYKEALRISPNYAPTHNNLGNALILQQGISDEAISHFKEALRLNPKYAEAYSSLSVALIHMGKIDEAVDILKKALQINPHIAATYVNLGGALMLQDKSDEAMDYFNKALQIKPDIAEAHVNLGIILYNKERLDEAIAHFRKALLIDPDNDEAQFNLNKALALLNEIDVNIERIQEDLVHKPEEPFLYLQLGNMYSTKGELDKAIAQYQKAISFQPDFPEALYHLAKLHIKRREYTKALSLYKKVITLLPDNPSVYYNVACIYANQNKPEESVAWLKKAVEKGFSDWKHIKTDGDLDNIRSSSYYKEFVNGQ